MCYGYWKKGIHQKYLLLIFFLEITPLNKLILSRHVDLIYVIDYLNNFKFSKEDISYLSNLKTEPGKKLFENKFFKNFKRIKI